MQDSALCYKYILHNPNKEFIEYSKRVSSEINTIFIDEVGLPFFEN